MASDTPHNKLSAPAGPGHPRTLGELLADRNARLFAVASGLLILGFYSVPAVFGQNGTLAALRWAWNACNSETDYTHGRFVPLAIAAVIYYKRRELLAASIQPRNIGLLAIGFGLLLFILSFRTLQPRVAMGALPIIVLGSSLYLWGWQVTKILAFPAFLIYFAIPLPGLNQATSQLQLVATQTAYHVSSVFGADLYARGNMIGSATGAWEELDIAGGCSGIRSLVALTLIAAVYGYLTQKKLWKMLVIFASSLPLALFANGMRITAIVLLSEYGDAEFARGSFHNFSGFIFFPLGIIGIMLVDLALNRRLPFVRRKDEIRVTVRRGKRVDEEGKDASPAGPSGA